MYGDEVVSWHARKLQHSLHYAGEQCSLACWLDEETVEWQQAGGVVTGPGACWPGDEQEQAQQQPNPQQAMQEQQPSAEQAKQQGRWPARKRLPSAMAVSATSGF